MFDFVMNNKKRIVVSLISVMILFLGLTFLFRKESTNLSEHQKRLRLYDQVQPGDEEINGTDYVSFDAFFKEDIDNDGNADGLRGYTLKVNDSKKLYLELAVFGDATLNNANITFERTNVRLSGNIGKSSSIKKTINSTDISSIELNDAIGNGTTSFVNVTVNANLTNDLKSYSGINKVKLTGTVHNNITGEDVDIEKEVEFEVDWYETDITATIGSDYTTEYVSVIDAATENAKVKYNFKTYTKTKALLKGAYITGTIPKLNGYDPVNVTISGTNVTSTYDSATLTFTAKREAELEDTLITTQAYTYKNGGIYYNEWQLEIEYPAEASYDNAALAMPVQAWYEGYNNLKPTYTSPIVSNKPEKLLVAKYVPDVSGGGDPTLFATHIALGSYSSALGKNYINKTAALKLYSDEPADEATTYYEHLGLKLISHNKYDVTNNVIINLLDERFNATENITSITKYNTISVTGANRYLGTSGYIKIYNAETDELIHIFTALDWNSPYTFDTVVRKIRIETSEISHSAYEDWMNANRYGGNHYIDILDFSIVKEIDNTALLNKYTASQFDSFDYVEGRTKTNLMITKNGSSNPQLFQENTTQYGTALYTTYRSSEISGIITDGTTEITSIDSTKEKNVSISLTTGQYGDIVQGWINGEFIVVLPKEILDIDIDNITISNPDVKIEGYEKNDIDGHKCIRILTSNSNEASYTITINGTIIPDARVASTTTKIGLYGYNGPIGLSDGHAKDIYDVNNNLDAEEEVNYSSIKLQIQAPNELITTTTYLDRNSKTTVSPLIADVNPIDDSNVGTVEIGITNSSQYSVENIVIIGKLGFVGNTYQVTSSNQSIDLGSEFDVKMVSDGITYPPSINGTATMLDGKVTFYYSEQETPTNDLNNPANAWKLKEQVTDFNSIKTYMIVINDYVLDPGKQAKFTYDVELPLNTSNLNKVTYFNHGVYYDAILDEGNHALVTGGAKLGIRVARQYNLELTNTKIASTRTIDKTKYLITAKGDSNEIIDQRLLTTNANGIATSKGLYVGQKYELKQISVKDPFVLDDETKKFEIKNTANDVLELENTGTYKSIDLTNNQKLNIELENEVKYDLVITNKDLNTDESIAYTKFKITGKGYENGKSIIADADGNINLSGLYLDEIYEVEQVNINKHLLTDNFTFSIGRDTDGIVKINAAPKVEKEYYMNYSMNYSNGTYYTDDGYAIVSIPIILANSSKRFYITADLENDIAVSAYTFRGDCRGDLAEYNWRAEYVPHNTFNPSNATRSVTVNASFEADSSGYDSVAEEDGMEPGYNYCLVFSNNDNGHFSISNINIIHADGTPAEKYTSETTVPTKENIYAVQTINDSDSLVSPVLTINVKNAGIPTYKLEITKKNADTQEVLAGAQYKITGPGLPESGTYLTTNQDGVATIELNKGVSNMYNNYGRVTEITLVNGIDYGQYGTEYTIEEVVAPVGYTLDNKKIVFRGRLDLTNGYANYYYANTGGIVYTYTTDLANETTNKLNYSNSTDTHFEEATWDGDTLKVTLQDYPIIQINKRDFETNEALPNTLFALYKVERLSGIEVLTPALNSKGEIIGTQTPIGNTDYYVIATDDNGQINLDLGAGSYKLIEVQAADEKYQLIDNTYYFGIGETVNYEEYGDIIGAFNPAKNFYRGSDNDSNEIFATSDGGWISSSTGDGYYLIKYDRNGKVEWISDAFNRQRVSQRFQYNYPLEPDRNYYTESGDGSVSSIRHITEASDGSGYYVSTNNYNMVTKYDQNGNKLWMSQDYTELELFSYEYACLYENNIDSNGNVLLYRYDEDTSSWIPKREQESQYDWNTNTWTYTYTGPLVYGTLTDQMKIDDEHYYCGYTSNYYNYTSAYSDELAPAPDGGVFMLTNTSYDFILSDGTIVPNKGSHQILHYDTNGNLVGVYDFNGLFIQAHNEYMARYNLDPSTAGYDKDYNGNFLYLNGDLYHAFFGAYDNGDIIFANQFGLVLKLRFNQTEDKFDIVYYTPVGFNGIKGFGWGGYYSNYDGNLDVQLFDDGGFTIIKNTSTSYSDTTEKIPYYNTDMQQYDNHSVMLDGYEQRFVYANSSKIVPIFNGEGKLTNVITAFSSNSKYPELEDQYNYKYDYLYKSANTSDGTAIEVLDDGSLLIAIDKSGMSLGAFNGTGREVILANGDPYYISDESSFIIYKMNTNSKIEWIKEYVGIDKHGSADVKMRTSKDGAVVLLPVRLNENAHELGSTEIINDKFGVSTGDAFLLIKLTEDVNLPGPEAYTLNIDNKRKEYKISASANEGGQIFVTNPDNGQNVINTDGSSKTELEKVKYGDTNKYDITIRPNDTYVVASVQVNGKDIPYTVNADGTILLDKITDIIEDKDITITFAKNKSQVIVKHYLKGTTTSVFGDEILVGDENDPYETEPKIDYLYSLATDENGEAILPANMADHFAHDPITVIYYYVKNEVQLITNYYVEGTEKELAPSSVQRKVLGSTYQTAPLDIDDYEYTRTIGDPSGILNTAVTEVTFMYQRSSTPGPTTTDSTITIRYVDKNTNIDIIPKITKTVTKGSDYTTDDPVTIPAKYRQVGTPTNATGTANDDEIEVIYYYEVIPFNVSVDKKINSILLNGEKQSFTNSKNVVITPAKKDNLIVYYEIILKNTGDIKANFTVVEGDIPGFVIYDKGNFTKTNNGYELTAELEPGEEKSYRIGYKWNQEDYGISTNKVELKEVTNPNGFDEPDALDNISTATVETKIPKEVLDTPIVDTIDKIGTSVILFITSMVGIIISIVLIKKKNS